MAENITINKRHVFTGRGAPEDSDKLCQDESQHPLKSVYIDEDSGAVYIRNGVNKVSADWKSPTGSYLVYKALLTQSSTDPPVAIVLQNTLGGELVWSYDSTGLYIGTLAGIFFQNKILMFFGNGFSANTLIGGGYNDSNSIFINTNSEIGLPNDGLLQSTSVRIEVYPND